MYDPHPHPHPHPAGALLCVLVVFVLVGFVAAFFPQTRTVRLVYAGIGQIWSGTPTRYVLLVGPTSCSFNPKLMVSRLG